MFSEMKEIIGELAEINIPLKPDAKPMKQRPYKLDLMYKQNVKLEIHRILDTCEFALRYLVNKTMFGGEKRNVS